MSGDVSDSPGRSSALVGVTVNRTDAIAAHLEREESGRRERAKSDECSGNVKDKLIDWLPPRWCWGEGRL